MARDVGDTVRDALGGVVREAIKNMGDATPTPSKSKGPLNGAKGVAAGVGLAAAAPFLAKKGFDAVRANGGPAKLASKAAPTNLASKAGDRVSDSLKDVVTSKVDEAGGAGGLVKEAASGLLPFGGGGGDKGGKGGAPGVGKGRRMPVQQAVDVAVPIETAYNQWTQFEEWPNFMHRVTRASQDDECTVKFATKIWGKTKEFEAKIETQRPDERVKWSVAQGITHTGVVTFHELAPRLTRIELNMDVAPGSLIEKAARGMRHVKRAARADLHRFKAFIEMAELETGAWRGRIEDGEVVEPHDDSYDEERDYSDIEDLVPDASESSEEEEDEEKKEDEEQKEDEGNGNGGGRSRTQRFKQQAESTQGGGEKREQKRERSRSGGSSSSSRSSSRGSSGGSKSGGSSSRSRSSSRS